jgi:hypothetical protein
LFHERNNNLAFIKWPLMTLCAVSLLSGFLTPAIPTCRADPATPVPDLYVTPDDFLFLSGGVVATCTTVQGDFVSIIVTVHNAGPGYCPPANASFFCDSTFLCITPVTPNINRDQVKYGASFLWDTTLVDIGNHTIRIDVNSSIGDTNLTNNSAEAKFNVMARPPTISLILSPPSQEANITESSRGVVEFSGRLRVITHDSSVATVWLNSTVEIGRAHV